MVVTLVVIAIAACLLFDWYWVRGRGRSRGSPRLSAVPRVTRETHAAEIFFHPGHAWTRLSEDGTATVGCDAFASSFAGELAAVVPPVPGANVMQGQHAWTLISARGRRLPQVMPLEGEILAVNAELHRDPRLANRYPYDSGWIVRIRPKDVRRGIRNLLRGDVAESWMAAIKSRATGRLRAAGECVAADGGEWIAAFGDQLDDETWNALQRDLFPVNERATERGA